MNTKPTISNYIEPVKQSITEYHSDHEAWDIAMQTLKDIYGMSSKLDWMSYAKLKSMVRKCQRDQEMQENRKKLAQLAFQTSLINH